GLHPGHVPYHARRCTRAGRTPRIGNCMIYCENRYLKMIDNQFFAQASDDAAKEPIPTVPMDLTDQAYLLRAFYEAVRDGRQPETSAEDNLRSIEMVFRTVESCESGQTVELTGGA